MNRKRFGALLIVPLLGVLVLTTGCPKRKAPRHNVVLITVDALRADHLGAYGYPRHTSPQIDRLAAGSLVFTNAFCPIPKTSASIASLLTGLHPFLHKTAPVQDELHPGNPTLAEMLSRQGYDTAAVVENANLSIENGFNRGFSRYTEIWKDGYEKQATAEPITRKAIEFLGEKHDKPFFLWLHYIDTHAPYLPPAEFVKAGPQDRGRLIQQIDKKVIAGTRVELERIAAGDAREGDFVDLYDGAIRYVDEQIGRVLREVQARFGADTVVIVSSDHGEELGDHNLFFDHGPLTFQSSSRIPLIVHFPGKSPQRIDRVVSFMDILPTVARDIAGAKIEREIQGVSLFDEHAERKLFIYGLFSHTTIHRGKSYISVNQSLQSLLGLPQGLYCYDLVADPLERKNLAAAEGKSFSQMDKLYYHFLNKNDYPPRGAGKKASGKNLDNLKTLGYVN